MTIDYYDCSNYEHSRFRLLIFIFLLTIEYVDMYPHFRKNFMDNLRSGRPAYIQMGGTNTATSLK